MPHLPMVCLASTLALGLLLGLGQAAADLGLSETSSKHRRGVLQTEAFHYDIDLKGSCRAEILYHCSHILTEQQKLVVVGSDATGTRAKIRQATATQQQQPVQVQQQTVVPAAAAVSAGRNGAVSGNQAMPDRTSQMTKSVEAASAALQELQNLSLGAHGNTGDLPQGHEGLPKGTQSTQSLLDKQAQQQARVNVGFLPQQRNVQPGDVSVLPNAGTQQQQVTQGSTVQAIPVKNGKKKGGKSAGAAAATNRDIGVATSVVDKNTGVTTTKEDVVHLVGTGDANQQKQDQPKQQKKKSNKAAVAGAGAGAAAGVAGQQGTTVVAKALKAKAAKPKVTGAGDSNTNDWEILDGVEPSTNEDYSADGEGQGRGADMDTLDALDDMTSEYEKAQQSGKVVSLQGPGGAANAVQQQPQRRRLLQSGAITVISMDTHIRKVTDQQEAVSQLLSKYGLNPSLPAAALIASSAPVARCLRRAVHEGLLSISPDAPQVGDECKAEVRKFFVERSQDARRDLPLLAACAPDALELCSHIDDPRHLLHCLKSGKLGLSPLCRDAVTMRQVEASEDISLDSDLQEACGEDRNRLCYQVGWGEGAAQACLDAYLVRQLANTTTPAAASSSAKPRGGKSKSSPEERLSPGCADALFQHHIQASEDIRFNYQLASHCVLDKQVFCRDIKPDRGEVTVCLEHHMGHPSFSSSCRGALAAQQQLKAMDVRLDFEFRKLCEADVRGLCGEETYRKLVDVTLPMGSGQDVMECLRQRRASVRNSGCHAYLTEILTAAYRDNRLDPVLQSTCQQDVAEHCRDSRFALSCLQELVLKKTPLHSPACSALVHERLRQASAELAFNPDLLEACAPEQQRYCSAAGLQGPAVIDCLVDHRKDVHGVSEECQAALLKHLMGVVSDIRLMSGLKEECAGDITSLCHGVEPGQGRVIKCLQEQHEKVSSPACRQQLVRLLGLVVDDYRLSYTMELACKADVQKYCAGEEHSPGQVHACLRRSLEHLTPACREAEEQLEQLEHSDHRLNPRLQTDCPLAISMFCANVPQGSSVIACLMSRMTQPNFPEKCKEQLSSMLDRSTVKYSLNTELKKACDADVSQHCPHAVDVASLASETPILGCLAQNSSVVGSQCRAQLAHVVQMQLLRYRIGMPLTMACDGDVMARCHVDKLSAPFLEKGYIQACLLQHASKLHGPCWSLISLFDDKQFERASALEKAHWAPGAADEAIEKVAAEVRRDLEPALIHTLAHKVKSEVQSEVVSHHEVHVKPRLERLLKTASMLLTVALVLGAISLYWYNRLVRKATRQKRLVVFKDGAA